MAKFGEGDPRWLVEDRVDGTNVNNWHWTEFNCTTWAKERLSHYLSSIIIKDDAEGFCKTTKVDTVSGEVTVSSRKGKIFVFYELEIKVNWEGNLIDHPPCTGKIHLPSLDTDDDDFEVNVTSDSKSNDDDKFCEIIRKNGVPTFRAKIMEFLSELKKEHAEKVLKGVPKKEESSTATPQQEQKQQKQQTQPKIQEKPKTISNTTNIDLKETFDASPADVYQAHLDPNRITAFTNSQCQLTPSVGGKFSFFNGNISGEFVELIPNQKIVEKWRFSNWPADYYSTVTIKFDTENYGTVLRLNQKGVPSDDVERVEQGWSQHFWSRMKMMCGWGATLC